MEFAVMGRVFARVAVIGVAVAMVVGSVAKGRDTTYPGGGAILGPGTPVSMTAPTSGQILQALGSPVTWTPVAASAVVDAVALGGDLSGTPNAAEIVALASTPFTGAAPSAGQVLGFSSGNYGPTNSASLTTINGTGTTATAATGTVTVKASDSYTAGDSFTITDGAGRTTTFELVGVASQPGSGGGNCAAWPCTYLINAIGAGLTATQTACAFKDIINNGANTCGLGGGLPTTGLGMTATSLNAVITLTDTATGTAGNVAITGCAAIGMTCTGMGTAVDHVASHEVICGSSTAGQVCDDVTIGAPLKMGTSLLISTAAPTISSGFGTGAAVSPPTATTAAFRIGVGTTTATTGVIGLPTAANGWNCFCSDLSTISTTVTYCKQTASTTTSATIGEFTDIAGAHAWADNDVLSVSCFAF